MSAALEPLDVLVVYVPVESTRDLLDALFAAGAGRLGSYEQCAWITRGIGQFQPIEDAQPVIGTLGMLEQLEEDRVEVVLPRALRRDVLAALRAAHPYEEPAFHVIATANADDA